MTDFNQYFDNDTVLHAFGGGGLVAIFSPLFAYLGPHNYFYIVAVPFLFGCLIEILQQLHVYPFEDHPTQTFDHHLDDVAEWTLGGVIFTLLIAISIHTGGGWK